MKHFEDLKLADKANESGANALGDAIRGHLWHLYNVDGLGSGNEPRGTAIEGMDV